MKPGGVPGVWNDHDRRTALLATWPHDQLRQVQGAVWRRLCFHVDGLAALSTWALLHRHGLLACLRSPGVALADLQRHLIDAEHTRVNAGCLRLALRSLENQGWVTTEGSYPGASTPSATRFRLTSAGETWCSVAKASRHAPVLLAATRHASQDLLHGEREPDDGLTEALAVANEGYGLLTSAPERWRHHLDGPLAATVLTALCAHGWPFSPGVDHRVGAQPRDLRVWLSRQGWVDDAGNATAAGAVAALLVSQYWYPLSYAETLRNLDLLWFGDPRTLNDRATDGHERHVDRALDIRFSGRVFEGPVRAPFLAQVLPVFDQEAGRQPSALVDVGAGDGTMLRDTWRAVVTETRRGPTLQHQPLLAIAVEPSAVARRASAATLAEAGIPHHVIEGDIGAPHALAQRLEGSGVDPLDCLFVGKSVIHNRAFQMPKGVDVHTLSPHTNGIFMDREGNLLPGPQVESSLVDWFAAWRPWWRRHGMVAIEAHIAPAGRATTLQGRSPLTALELLHGYSHQLLVEPAVHRAAAHAAGLRSMNAARIGEDTLGYVTMTVDHWRASEGRAGP